MTPCPRAEAAVRAGQPGPLLRRGPRPLLLHLMLAAMRSTGCIAEWLNWSAAWPGWSAATRSNPAGRPDGAPDAEDIPPPGMVGGALVADGAMIAGIAAYRRHPAQRTLRDPAAIWEEGEARLLDYAPRSDATPVLFVPSLINRGYILDLAPGRSLLRYLAARGTRPLLLDWGWPGMAERGYTLTDYIAGPLERAIAAVGRPVILVGYCMGGLLALAAAQRRPDLVSALALLATPWDFRAHDPEQADMLARLVPRLQPLLDLNGTLPIDALQSIFAMLDPMAVRDKFRSFGRMDQGSARARLFVAIEDWANDGVPLAAPVARECFAGWYGANTPMKAAWRVAGQPVIPETLNQPSLVVVPGHDRVVPPAAARPLAQALSRAQIMEPTAGHVGMVAGGGAEAALWKPLLEWIKSN